MRNLFSKEKQHPVEQKTEQDGTHLSTPHGNNAAARSSSPTPSELEELNRPFLPPGWYKERRFQVTIATMLVLLIGVIIFAIYHKKIEDGLMPFAHWMKSKKAGWLIPIALMFIVSFPPLFGHEIIGILVGDVYGLGVGFGIVAAGTLLGEVANYFAFKYWCKSRARQYENRHIFMACLSRALVDGGFVLAAVVRYSVIPSHFTTSVFATCGMGFWTFLASAVVSLPKQLGVVAVGVLLASSGAQSGISSPSRKVSIVLLVLSTVMTIVSLQYVRRKVEAQKLGVIRDRRTVGLL